MHQRGSKEVPLTLHDEILDRPSRSSPTTPNSTAERLVLLYTLPALSIILLPILLFALGLLNSFQTISLILLLAGL